MGEEVIAMAETGESSYRRFLSLDKNALDQILVTYSDALVRFAYSLVQNSAVAEDIAAESIAVLLMKRRSFRDEGHLRAYVYKIVRNKAMDFLRHHRNMVPLEDVENVLGSGDPALGFLQSQRNQTVYRCLQKLPEQYRQVLQLSYFDGFDVSQITHIMNKSTKQVYNLLFRAKTSLKELLEKEGISHEDL